MQWLPAILIFPYLILLLDIYRSLRKTKPYFITSEPTTFVSVVVACHNEQEKLPVLLKSLNEQDYFPYLYEVIIVNDNSEDSTFNIASAFSGNFSINTINNTGNGKKKALETGINASSGNLIITTDADCRPGKSWIRTIAAFYEAEKPDMIICPVQLEQRPGFFGRFQELEFLSLQGITAGSVNAGNGTMCNGGNLAFKKESYLKHKENLFPGINSGDDIFLLHSLKKEPASKILWLESNDAIVTTASSPTLLTFLRQRKRWISKSSSYSDTYTILLGIVTFVTILLLASLLISAVFYKSFIAVLVTVLVLKSVPDFLILTNTSARYANRKIMKWFIPSQLVYPLYVIGVVLFSLTAPEKRRH